MSIDANNRSERLAFLQIDEQTLTTLREIWRLAEPALPGILDRFYDHVMAVPGLAAVARC